MKNSHLSVILDSRAESIDDNNLVWTKTFRSAGRTSESRACLMVSVAGLTETTESPEIELNGKSIGSIRNYRGQPKSHWYTQLIPFNSSLLKRDADTDNQISIKAVPGLVKTLQGDRPADKYFVKDIICFFHRDGRSALDFKILHGDSEKRLGEGRNAEDLWTVNFDAFPGENAKFAHLMCNVKGLTGSHRDVNVNLNGQRIGDIDDYEGQNSEHWFTQGIAFPANLLRHGSNRLEIEAVGISQEFSFKNLVCLYQELVPIQDTDNTILGIIPVAVDKPPQSTFVGDFAWMTDRRVRIGDKGEIIWENDFLTSNRIAAGQAFLMFTLSGLSVSQDNPMVTINQQTVGHLQRYEDANPKQAFTQMITIDASILNNGNNTIKVTAVGNPGGSGSDVFDDFSIRAALCFFHRKGLDGTKNDNI